ncbi:nucleotide exchange factor GrpE [Rhodopirellula sp. P2]|uniref:nucleotide exchange factor GrpE n=1 Tax=Rhodopirellula sp. P2 TaxID=2127060 RepID=UPI0023683FE4|nr:nucleotide exchange factor GrpE [Rhodopirellula sp. P2]WDQ15111.1 nucleotide exchange factor GrpE [Rhodopirellula sp. P2]
MNIPADDDWPQTRAAIKDRFLAWIDTAGETDHGRQQLARMLAELDQQENSDASAPTAAQAEATQQAAAASLHGLGQITRDLTALRHELKLNTKQNRSLSDTLASDAERIVAASDALLEQLHENSTRTTAGQSTTGKQVSPADASMSETTRSAITAIVEVDEALSRLTQAFEAAVQDCPTPPSTLGTGWFGRRKFEQHEQLWQTAWQSRNQSLNGLAEGLRLTTQRMSQQLASLNIERVGAPGDAFDPQTMQVLEVQPSSEHPVGTVLRVLRTGYQQGTWLIRPAQVVTAQAITANS